MSGIFGSAKKQDPVRMPVQGDRVARAAADRERRRVMARSGRESTRLDDSSGGTKAFRNSLLGQG